MNDALQEFLGRRLPLPGVAAWGACFPDRSLTSHCYSDWFTGEQVEQVLHRLVLAAESLRRRHLDPVRQCWTFEHARVYIALRRDGVVLALFVENRPELASETFTAVLKEFAALPFD